MADAGMPHDHASIEVRSVGGANPFGPEWPKMRAAVERATEDDCETDWSAVAWDMARDLGEADLVIASLRKALESSIAALDVPSCVFCAGQMFKAEILRCGSCGAMNGPSATHSDV